MESLPLELLASIMGYMNLEEKMLKMTCVSKVWKYAILGDDPHGIPAWDNVWIDLGDNVIANEKLKSIKNTLYSKISFDLSYCYKLRDVSALGNVHKLDLSGCENIDVSVLDNYIPQ